MTKNKISKYIYFDKETIQNILEDTNKGQKSKTVHRSNTQRLQASVEAEAKTEVKLNIPFHLRLAFLFSSKLNTEFLFERNSKTTITSTELSEFREVEKKFKKFESIVISDIKNSSTLFMVAGTYYKLLSGSNEALKDFDFSQIQTVIREYNGYDIYKIDEENYVRFNSDAFLSNYCRNELLSTTLDLFALKVGEFPKDDFDFQKQLEKLGDLFDGQSNKTLAELYSPEVIKKLPEKSNKSSNINLWDAVVAVVGEKP
ncbi:MAG: DUF6414 family protein [Lactococcus lactis]|nr:DUF6414 family protein [Lactococcus lactis]